MDNLDRILPPDLELALQAYYTAHSPSADFASDLERKLQALRIQPAQSPDASGHRLQRQPALAVLLILLVLLLIAGVAYAIGSAVGFIPGIGLVEQNTRIRVLAAPVTAKNQGITVTILQVVADSAHTFVAFRVAGIPPTNNGWPVCENPAALRLPDGSALELKDSRASGMESELGRPMIYDVQLTYGPVPEHVQRLTFFLPCILPTSGAGPENWEIPFTLSPAPLNLATPAAIIGPTYIAAGPRPEVTPPSTPGEASPPGPTAVPTRSASGLYLDKVIDLPNSYILLGEFVDAGNLLGPVVITDTSAYDYRPEIVDANGKSVSFDVRTDVHGDVSSVRGYSWAYEIPKPAVAPLTLTLAKVNVIRQSSARFPLDTGPNPQPMQVWHLNLPLHLADHDYVVDDVQLLRSGYLIRFHSGPEVPEGTSYLVDILGSSLAGNSTVGQEIRSKDKVLYTQNFVYSSAPPTGALTVELTLMDTIPLDGPWVLIWSPPTSKP